MEINLMKIHGLQKLTLLDYPEHVACTIFLGGCDFRCPYCHNFELVDGTASPLMDEKELFSFLEKRKGLLDGVAITGGEPCLHPELPELIAAIRKMGYAVKLDTNGYHPDVLRALLSRNLLDYIAMDIKNSYEKYPATTGCPEIQTERIRESIQLLIGGKIPCEFRTTVVREFHEEKDFELIGLMIQGADRYYLQSFTDRETVPRKGLHSPSAEDLRTYASLVRPYVQTVEIRGVSD